jgi:hypothetical protein
MTDLPTYKVTIDEAYKEGDEELGVEMIAFTNNPAIIVKGMAYKSQVKAVFADEKKYRITAPAMIPMDIYRRDDDMGEYSVQFTEEVIDQMHSKLMANLKLTDLFNLEHEASEVVPAYILEAWIVDDPKKDKAYTKFGIEVPKGTLMVTAQITDKDYYNSLVESGRTGFSIEGMLGLEAMEQLSNNQNKYSMKLPDGEHEIDGKIYVVTGGEVVEIKDKEVAMAEEPKEEEVKEEEMAEEETVEEEETTEVKAEVNPETDSEAILAIVQPVLDAAIAEVLQVIADLKNELTESNAEEEVIEETMSKFSALQNYINFTKQNG